MVFIRAHVTIMYLCSGLHQIVNLNMFLCLRLRCVVPQVFSWTWMMVGRESVHVCVHAWYSLYYWDQPG